MHVQSAHTHISHHIFQELPSLIPPNSVIVLNDTRVYPARIFLTFPRRRHEFLITQMVTSTRNEVTQLQGQMRNRKKCHAGDTLNFCPGLTLTYTGPCPEDSSLALLQLSTPIHYDAFIEILYQHGQMPIPPYIDRPYDKTRDDTDYQTVFAKNGFSVAAPTAGLHFSHAQLTQLQQQDIKVVKITLDVGYGTFKLMDQADIRQHQIHSEKFKITEAAWEKISQAEQLVAVGTTSLRAIETFERLENKTFDNWLETNLFITPGSTFKKVNHLITNFHLPRSSLLCLTHAFGGIDLMRRAYQEAIHSHYRFYSYGDAMLISR